MFFIYLFEGKHRQTIINVEFLRVYLRVLLLKLIHPLFLTLKLHGDIRVKPAQRLLPKRKRL